MFSQNLAQLSKKRHVLILVDVLQKQGGLPPPQPRAHFLGNLARSNALPSHSMFCRWRGGAVPPQTPPLRFIAPHSQARPSSAEPHLSRCFAKAGGAAPPATPCSFFGQLSKKYRFAIPFDVLQMGGRGCASPNPPADIHSTTFAGKT